MLCARVFQSGGMIVTPAGSSPVAAGATKALRWGAETARPSVVTDRPLRTAARNFRGTRVVLRRADMRGRRWMICDASGSAVGWTDASPASGISAAEEERGRGARSAATAGDAIITNANIID